MASVLFKERKRSKVTKKEKKRMLLLRNIIRSSPQVKLSRTLTQNAPHLRGNLTRATSLGAARFYSANANSSRFKSWDELSLAERQEFVRQLTSKYKEIWPCSKTNLSLHTLSDGMEEFEDSPAVFGIFYNDILDEKHSADSRFAHPSFRELLVKRN